MNNVTRSQKELAAIQLTPEQKLDVDRWVEIEFAYATLGLEGVVVSREEVARVAAESANAAAGFEDNREIRATLKSIRAVRSHAEDHGGAAALTPSFLIELHGSEAESRAANNPQSSQSSPDSAGATRLVAKLESACHWFAAESFLELHPAEQAAIVLLRLIELRPFEGESTRVALAASSLFTLRSGLPPIVVSSSLQASYREALKEGMKMNTKPMVDLVAQALVASISEIVGRLRAK